MAVPRGFPERERIKERAMTAKFEYGVPESTI
jgi:hypothetical protein